MIRKALAVLAVAGAALWVVALLHPTLMDAMSHRAVRSFSASWVLPDGRLEVTITPTGYGSIGQVVETLPSGFSYTGSDLSETAVAVEGQTVAFTLLGDERFTYTITAPDTEGPYSFSGVLLDSDKAEEAIGGDSSIRVGQAPTPMPEPTTTPEPTLTPTLTPTPTPERTATPTTLEPTPTVTPEGTATPTTLEPTPTVTLAATPTLTPTTGPEPTLTSAPPAPEPEERPPLELIVLIGAVAVLAVVAVIAFARRRRR